MEKNKYNVPSEVFKTLGGILQPFPLVLIEVIHKYLYDFHSLLCGAIETNDGLSALSLLEMKAICNLSIQRKVGN